MKIGLEAPCVMFEILWYDSIMKIWLVISGCLFNSVILFIQIGMLIT